MSFDCAQFREYIVRPALADCVHFAAVPAPPFVEELLVATCAQETGLGHYLHQLGDGPAVGIYQIEVGSLRDLLGNFITPAKNAAGSSRYADLLRATSTLQHPVEEELIWNLRLATVICRLFYYRVREPLPAKSDFASLWHYYKTYYNSSLGAATEDSFRTALRAHTNIAVA